MKMYELSFVCRELNLDEETLVTWIDARLITPADSEGPLFDDEDFGRLRLISEIRNTYNTNQESIEVILHLIDQIHLLNQQLISKKKS